MKRKFGQLIKRCAREVWRRLDKPVPALPVDLLRIGVGVLGAAYCWHLYRDVRTIGSRDGVVDHELIGEMFPYTRLRLLPINISDKALRSVYLTGAASSLSVAAGIGIRPNATYLFAIASSTYRRNFITMYVDDAIMHLALFWLMLLPTGQTLTLNGQTRQPWQTATVPGFAVRAFVANLSLIYFVAGIWKWNSPLWKQGMGLYTSLKMPISYAPRFWSARWQPFLAPFSYAAMVAEPLIALLPLLPERSWLKYGVGANAVALHVGIIGLLRVPYANVACLAALPLFFREELMGWLGVSAERDAPIMPETPYAHAAVASTVLSLLTLANLWRISEWNPTGRDPMRHHSNPWNSILWLLGIAQSYRLMDWIDRLNWHVYYEGEEVVSAETHPFDPDRLFPKSSRNVFLHSYIQNTAWMVPPEPYREALQTSLLTRFVEQFARNNPNTGQITIYSNIGRITRDNINLREMRRFKLLEFSVTDGVANIEFMQLVGDAEG